MLGIQKSCYLFTLKIGVIFVCVVCSMNMYLSWVVIIGATAGSESNVHQLVQRNREGEGMNNVYYFSFFQKTNSIKWTKT